jgi:hypothetical protein
MTWDLNVGFFLDRTITPIFLRIFRRNAMCNITTDMYISRKWAQAVTSVSWKSGHTVILSEVEPCYVSFEQIREMNIETVGWICRFATYQM